MKHTSKLQSNAKKLLTMFTISIFSMGFLQPTMVYANKLQGYSEIIENQELITKLDRVIERTSSESDETISHITHYLDEIFNEYPNNDLVKAVVNYLKTGLQDQTSPFRDKTIVQTASESGLFPTLVAAVIEAELADSLSEEGPFTVFAPTEEAFGNLLEKLDMSASELLQNKELLKTVLLYHVIQGDIRQNDVLSLNNNTMVKSLEGSEVTVINNGGVMIDYANVVQTDIVTSNGVIHVIDAVILPEDVLISLGMDVNMDKKENIYDKTMTTIVDVAVKSESFPTLVAALQSADLVDTLMGDGPFTVFAPTEEAFSQLLLDLNMTAEELLEDKELLTNVLLYHVLPGKFLAEDVLNLPNNTSVETVGGNEILIKNVGGVMVNNANITDTDIIGSNGVIHVIDKVLLP